MPVDYVNESDVISSIALGMSMIALYITLRQLNLNREALSLSTFIRSLDELGTEKSRSERNYIRSNFPDFAAPEIKSKKVYPLDSKEGKEVRFWIRVGESLESEAGRNLSISELKGTDRKKFEMVAVSLDRVGFMLSELKSTKKLRTKYIDWMANSICDMWNRTAPYIQLERRKRGGKFTPYFEQMANDAYALYDEQMKSEWNANARLVVLKKDPTRLLTTARAKNP